MSLTLALSGPERTRAACELAIEDAGLALLPSDHHARWDWEHKLPAPKKHGWTHAIAADADALNACVRAVEPHGWVLRAHFDTPPKPQPTPAQVMAATLAEMRAEIDALKAKVR